MIFELGWSLVRVWKTVSCNSTKVSGGLVLMSQTQYCAALPSETVFIKYNQCTAGACHHLPSQQRAVVNKILICWWIVILMYGVDYTPVYQPRLPSPPHSLWCRQTAAETHWSTRYLQTWMLFQCKYFAKNVEIVTIQVQVRSSKSKSRVQV